jgi:hypothetical protein
MIDDQELLAHPATRSATSCVKQITLQLPFIRGERAQNAPGHTGPAPSAAPIGPPIMRDVHPNFWNFFQKNGFWPLGCVGSARLALLPDTVGQRVVEAVFPLP